MRAFLSGDLEGGVVRVHGVTKDISLRGSAGFGGISTVPTAPPVDPTVASKTIRTFGGKLSWPDTLLGPGGTQGGATGISDFLGSLWAAGLADRASRRQQSKAGLFHICQLRPRCYEVCGPRPPLPLSLQSSDVHPISESTELTRGHPVRCSISFIPSLVGLGSGHSALRKEMGTIIF